MFILQNDSNPGSENPRTAVERYQNEQTKSLPFIYVKPRFVVYVRLMYVRTLEEKHEHNLIRHGTLKHILSA